MWSGCKSSLLILFLLHLFCDILINSVDISGFGIVTKAALHALLLIIRRIFTDNRIRAYPRNPCAIGTAYEYLYLSHNFNSNPIIGCSSPKFEITSGCISPKTPAFSPFMITSARLPSMNAGSQDFATV